MGWGDDFDTRKLDRHDRMIAIGIAAVFVGSILIVAAVTAVIAHFVLKAW